MSKPIAYWREGYEEDEAKFRMDEMKRRLEVNQKTITRLRAENERLKCLLRQTVHLARNYAQKPAGSIFEDAMREAEASLQETGDERN